jgi:hypothetical protein
VLAFKERTPRQAREGSTTTPITGLELEKATLGQIGMLQRAQSREIIWEKIA